LTRNCSATRLRASSRWCTSQAKAEADLKAFEDCAREPLVRECWMLSGEIDFVLKCVAPDLKTFQAFVAELTAVAARARNVKTSLDAAHLQGRRMVPRDEIR
jgi:DNA-binding Lrp family transcriptional regulator